MHKTLSTACSLLPRTCSAGCISSVNICFFDQIALVAAWAHSWYKMLRNYDYFCCLGVLILFIYIFPWTCSSFWHAELDLLAVVPRQLWCLKKITPSLPQCREVKTRGGVCVCLLRGFLASDQQEQPAFGGKKMRMHIRRQHLVLGPQVPATEQKCCLCTVLLQVGLSLCVQRGVSGEV